MSVITCPSCGTPAPPGAVFCDHCGYDLRTVAPAAPPPVPPTFAVPSADGVVVCPACQHPNIAGSAFCENCGGNLSQAAVPQPAFGPPAPVAAPPAVPAGVPSPVPQPPVAAGVVTGRLVITDSKVTLPIPSGKAVIIIGREDPVSGVFPDIDLDPHGGHEAGVGRRHAQLSIQGGQVFVEDLDSVNGTAVNRQRVLPHKPQPLNSGDEIRFGKMALIYYAS